MFEKKVDLTALKPPGKLVVSSLFGAKKDDKPAFVRK